MVLVCRWDSQAPQGWGGTWIQAPLACQAEARCDASGLIIREWAGNHSHSESTKGSVWMPLSRHHRGSSTMLKITFQVYASLGFKPDPKLVWTVRQLTQQRGTEQALCFGWLFPGSFMCWKFGPQVTVVRGSDLYRVGLSGRETGHGTPL